MTPFDKRRVFVAAVLSGTAAFCGLANATVEEAHWYDYALAGFFASVMALIAAHLSHDLFPED